jgi:hypothetical protein
MMALATARAAATVETTATASVTERAVLRLEAANTGDAPVDDVTSEVVYQGHDERGAPLATLPSGARHTWTFDLPPPAEPGAVAAMFRVTYTDRTGHRTSIPAVTAVETPGLLPVPEVHATLTVSPVARFGRAAVALENPTPAPVHGRVIVALPGGLTIEPESQPAAVPAQGRSEVPLVVQNDGAASGSSAPMFALFDYVADGRRHLIVAPAVVTVDTGRAAAAPLLVRPLSAWPSRCWESPGVERVGASSEPETRHPATLAMPESLRRRA